MMQFRYVKANVFAWLAQSQGRVNSKTFQSAAFLFDACKGIIWVDFLFRKFASSDVDAPDPRVVEGR